MGVVVDAGNPNHLLILGLFVSGLCNIALSLATDSLYTMTALVVVNGMAQAIGWPALARIFLATFENPQRRGSLYSLLSTSQNAGAALVPLILVPSIVTWGGYASMVVPGLIASCCSLVLIAVLPPFQNGKVSSSSGSKKKSWQVISDTLKNIKLFQLGMMYLFVSFVRSSITDWCSVFLSEAKGYNMTTSGSCLFSLELGGFIGSLAAGYISDAIFHGNRAPVMIGFCFLSTIPLSCLLVSSDSLMFLCSVYFLIGWCTMAPHVLVGLYTREIVQQDASISTAGGYVKCIGQLGSAAAGFPLAYTVNIFGWNSMIYLTLASCFCAGFSILSLRRSSPIQKRD